MTIRDRVAGAKTASIPMGSTTGEIKNLGLERIAHALKQHEAKIRAANAEDLERSEKENLPAPLLKRLKFDSSKMAEVCSGLESLITLPDPVGVILSARELDSGLHLYQVTCPIGVIGVIFESRPDALVQISALCLKSGNSVLLKGGSEAKETNKVLADIIASASIAVGLPAGWVQLLEGRDEVKEILTMDDAIDLLIPRGSNRFVQYIMDNTSIPVLGHAEGICHIYIDKEADLDMGIKVTVDAKTQYAAVCNAVETLLVHKDIAPVFLPKAAEVLKAEGVELRGCDKTCAVIKATKADESDWRTEYLDYILSIKVVNSLDEAILHINTYGSGHTDSIVTANRDNAERFMNLVDSANVFWNCSTRFSDGFRYGLGAEVGISTSKIHARGPVGLEGLVIYKWKLKGSGQIVADYTGEKARPFTHKPLPKEFILNI
ncbi:MAG: glutamate-5-semialdehyde dehydrogenase [Spirochaetota bacterium]